MISVKKIALYSISILMIAIVCTILVIFFRPKVTITFDRNTVFSMEEKNTITSIINREYIKNPLHMGSEYSINITEPQKVTNPEKMEYDLFVRGHVRASEIVDSTGIGENSWSLVVAKNKVGD